MGCISSKIVTRSSSFHEELKQGLQSRVNGMPVIEDLLLSKNGADQFLTLVCTANTVTRKLHTGVSTLEIGTNKNPTTEQASLETINTWELMEGLDEREIEESGKETFETSCISTLTPSRNFHRVQGTDGGDGSFHFESFRTSEGGHSLFTRCFHTVEEYETMVARNELGDGGKEGILLRPTGSGTLEVLEGSRNTNIDGPLHPKTLLVGSQGADKGEDKVEDTRNGETRLLEASRNHDPLSFVGFCTAEFPSVEPSVLELTPWDGNLPCDVGNHLQPSGNEELEFPNTSRTTDMEPSMCLKGFNTVEGHKVEAGNWSIEKGEDTTKDTKDGGEVEVLESSRNCDHVTFVSFSITKSPSTKSFVSDSELAEDSRNSPRSFATCEVSGYAKKGNLTNEKGSRRRARAKDLCALSIPAANFSFPAVGSLKDWFNTVDGPYITPRFGNSSNSKEPDIVNGNDNDELAMFDPEVVAAFEAALEKLTAEEEFVLRQIMERWEDNDEQTEISGNRQQ